MHVLITGGAGFIGSHLAERHIQWGDRVTVLDDLSTGSLNNLAAVTDAPNLELRIGSVTDEALTVALVEQCDVVYHLAAAVGVKLIINDPVDTIERNVIGTMVLFRAAARFHKPVLIASTSEVYGKQPELPFREDSDLVLGPTTKPRWSYACSKAIDEFLALAYWKENGLPIVVVRLFNVAGPRQTGAYGMVIPNLVRQALRNEDIIVFGSGEQCRCFLHVSDAVDALRSLAVLPAARGQVLNLGSTQEISILDLARKIKALTGSSSSIVTIPYDEAYEAGFEDMERRVPDCSRIVALMGFHPKFDLDGILKSVIDYERQRVENGFPKDTLQNLQFGSAAAK